MAPQATEGLSTMLTPATPKLDSKKQQQKKLGPGGKGKKEPDCKVDSPEAVNAPF